MKKPSCLFLALSLLCAGIALADTNITTDGGTGSTTVTKFCTVIPLPRPTMTVTAHTPMMIPSMVRKVRILLPDIFFRARVKVSQRLMTAHLPPGRKLSLIHI